MQPFPSRNPQGEPYTIAQQIERVARDRFAWPGGYSLVLLMHDGQTLCCACAEDNLGAILRDTIGETRDESSGWCASAAAVADDDDDAETCAHCGRDITDGTDSTARARLLEPEPEPALWQIADTLRDALAGALADATDGNDEGGAPIRRAFLSSVNYPRDFARDALATFDIPTLADADADALADALGGRLGFADADTLRDALADALGEPDALRAVWTIRQGLGLEDRIGEGQAYSEPARERERHALPDLEVFAVGEGEWYNLPNGERAESLADALGQSQTYAMGAPTFADALRDALADALSQAMESADTLADTLADADTDTLADIDALSDALDDAGFVIEPDALAGAHADALADLDIEPAGAGYYWRVCLPGCLPESDPFGPFLSATDALADARENTGG